MAEQARRRLFMKRIRNAFTVKSPGGNKNPMIVLLQPSTDRVVTHRAQGEPEGQILPFRPRGSLFARNVPRPPPVPDLEKYERVRDEPDDFRHRMIMNGLGLGVTVVLIVTGIWIADVMAHMRKDQDCVLTGRSNCTPIDVPRQPR
jgi:hypothetical protein